MSQTTKKMMSLELEFISPEANGFINWIDQDGESLATLGLGETGLDSEGESTGGSKYLEWNLEGLDFIKITGGGIQFDEQRSLSIDGIRDITTIDEYGDETITSVSYIPSQIQLNSPDYTDIEKANVIYPYVEPIEDSEGVLVEQPQSDGWTNLNNVKVAFADNTNAMILEHEHTIAFSNPVSNRLMGEIDMVNEAFVWYGAFSLGSVVDDSMFEIKRTNPEKYNFTINADATNKPEIAFKEEDIVTWSISVDTNLILKDVSGNGLEISDTATTFTGEIIYNGQPLIDYFYEKSALDSGVLDTRYYEKSVLDDGVLDTRYYIKSEIDTLITEAEERIREEFDLKIEAVMGVVEKRTSYYMYDGEWNLIDCITVDEEYDLPNTAEMGDIYHAKLEDTFHEYITDFTQLNVEEVHDKNLPVILTTDNYALINDGLDDIIYQWDSGWSSTALTENDIYTTVQHKSDITIDGVYKIVSTGRYYKYETGDFTEIDNPLPYYFDESNLPTQFNFDTIVKNTFTS